MKMPDKEKEKARKRRYYHRHKEKINLLRKLKRMLEKEKKEEQLASQFRWDEIQKPKGFPSYGEWKRQKIKENPLEDPENLTWEVYQQEMRDFYESQRRWATLKQEASGIEPNLPDDCEKCRKMLLGEIPRQIGFLNDHLCKCNQCARWWKEYKETFLTGVNIW